MVVPFLKDGSVVAVDDAYYDFLHTDTAYINITRKKLGLKPIDLLDGNASKSHALETENFLKQYFQHVKSVTDEYKKNCQNDLSISYFGNELNIRSLLGMEQVKQLESRFGAWEVLSRKGDKEIK